jgi:hypothetical protein
MTSRVADPSVVDTPSHEIGVRRMVERSSGIELLRMNVVAEGLRALHGASDNSLPVAVTEVALTWILLGAATDQQVSSR